jgi:hypothetical protein
MNAPFSSAISIAASRPMPKDRRQSSLAQLPSRSPPVTKQWPSRSIASKTGSSGRAAKQGASSHRIEPKPFLSASAIAKSLNP